jgi:SAM-dependent methyltransferase
MRKIMNAGERQVSACLDNIRRDHVARYEFAAQQLGGKRVLDAGCGVGYGSFILANGGCKIRAWDIDRDAIEFARAHYAHENIEFFNVGDNALPAAGGRYDAAVCFEVIEHIWNPARLLNYLHDAAPLLIASVPNEEVFPWNGTAYHHRHYTSGEFETLLNACGWEVTEWYGQAGAESEVEKNLNGRTIIAVCVHRDFDHQAPQLPKQVQLETNYSVAVPNHVAILGLGPSVTSFLEFTKRLGGRSSFCDEVWGINALGDVFDCDRVFHMDDIRIQELRATERPDSNISSMVHWLRTHKKPVYTSQPHPEYPCLVPYPLEYVVNNTGYAYMNSTAAHAVAFAVAMGVKKLSLFGMDFTYANSHHSEKGRGCVEFWLGFAAARGIAISIPQRSSLMDGCEPDRGRPYGYDLLDVRIDRDNEGFRRVTFFERDVMPTADEMEKRYDHTAHPNPLVNT